MIYINEEVMFDSGKYLIEGNFAKINEIYYFVGEELSMHSYLCAKLVPNKSNRYDIEFVKILTENGKKENVLDEYIVTSKEDIETILRSLFHFLSYEENEDNVFIGEKIIPLILIKDYMDTDIFCYSEGTELIYEFLELFAFKGKATRGFYEGDLVLRDVQLINDATGQVIKRFDDINLSSNFYIEEDDEEIAESIIEAYLESMSEFQINKVFKDALIRD